MRILAALALLCLSTPAARADGRTIVGEWAEGPKDCGTPFAYRIGPRSLANDALSCAFQGVSRRGDVVTFTGRCSDGESTTPGTVVATRTGDRLALRFSASGEGPTLSACPRKVR